MALKDLPHPASAGDASGAAMKRARPLPAARAWLSGHAALFKQATRLAVAATLAIVVVKLFRLPAGFWAPLSALAVLQGQIGASVAAARNYIFANVVGILLGVLIVVTFGKDLPVVALGIFAIAALATWLRLPSASASTAAAIVPVLVLLVEGDPWRYGGYRFLDILVGMAAAVLVSFLVFPQRAAVQLRDEVAAAVRELTESVAAALEALAAGRAVPDGGVVAEHVVGRLKAAQDQLAASRFEPRHRAAVDELIPFYLTAGSRLFERATAVLDSAGEPLPAPALAALAPGLAGVAPALRRTGAVLADGIEAGTAGSPVAGAAAALAALNETRGRVKAVDLTAVVAGDDLLRVYAFRHELGDLARELEQTLAHIARPGVAPAVAERPVPVAAGPVPMARQPVVARRLAGDE